MDSISILFIRNSKYNDEMKSILDKYEIKITWPFTIYHILESISIMNDKDKSDYLEKYILQELVQQEIFQKLKNQFFVKQSK